MMQKSPSEPKTPKATQAKKVKSSKAKKGKRERGRTDDDVVDDTNPAEGTSDGHKPHRPHTRSESMKGKSGKEPEEPVEPSESIPISKVPRYPTVQAELQAAYRKQQQELQELRELIKRTAPPTVELSEGSSSEEEPDSTAGKRTSAKNRKDRSHPVAPTAVHLGTSIKQPQPPKQMSKATVGQFLSEFEAFLLRACPNPKDRPSETHHPVASAHAILYPYQLLTHPQQKLVRNRTTAFIAQGKVTPIADNEAATHSRTLRLLGQNESETAKSTAERVVKDSALKPLARKVEGKTVDAQDWLMQTLEKWTHAVDAMDAEKHFPPYNDEGADDLCRSEDGKPNEVQRETCKKLLNALGPGKECFIERYESAESRRGVIVGNHELKGIKNLTTVRFWRFMEAEYVDNVFGYAGALRGDSKDHRPSGDGESKSHHERKPKSNTKRRRDRDHESAQGGGAGKRDESASKRSRPDASKSKSKCYVTPVDVPLALVLW